MNVGSLPTGTVSSGRADADTPAPRDHDADADADPATRIAELERENEALRAAVEKQRRENERIVERYERLLEQERDCTGSTTADRSRPASDTDADTSTAGRIARFFGLSSDA